jgi:lipopolysaccharide biosynthesis glycosyltransferase
MLIHKPLWRDEEIRCLHYILPDKPWHAKVSDDDTGEFAKSHRWWWDSLEQLGQEMKGDTEDWMLVLANVAQ